MPLLLADWLIKLPASIILGVIKVQQSRGVEWNHE